MIGEAVLREARAMIGTRWKHLGRGPGGIDCIGLVIVAAGRAGLALPDPSPYAREPSGQRLRLGIGEVLDPVALPDVRDGDVLVFNMGLYAGHVGLASTHPAHGKPAVVHAYLPRGRVVEELLAPIRASLTGAYRWREA